MFESLGFWTGFFIGVLGTGSVVWLTRYLADRE